MAWEEPEVFLQTLGQRWEGVRPGIGWGGSISLRKDAASPGGDRGKQESPAERLGQPPRESA